MVKSSAASKKRKWSLRNGVFTTTPNVRTHRSATGHQRHSPLPQIQYPSTRRQTCNNLSLRLVQNIGQAKAMDILPRALTKENIQQYEADLANPGAGFADTALRRAYLKLYGNICYVQRDQYIHYPWSSEMNERN